MNKPSIENTSAFSKILIKKPDFSSSSKKARTANKTSPLFSHSSIGRILHKLKLIHFFQVGQWNVNVLFQGGLYIVTQLRDTQQRSILLHLSKMSCLEKKATEVFLPNTSLQYLKVHGAEDGCLSCSWEISKSLVLSVYQMCPQMWS